MKRKWIRVFKDKRINDGKTWNIKFSQKPDEDGFMPFYNTKAEAVKIAYRFAEAMKPCKVRIFSAAGKLQVDYLVA